MNKLTVNLDSWFIKLLSNKTHPSMHGNKTPFIETKRNKLRDHSVKHERWYFTLLEIIVVNLNGCRFTGSVKAWNAGCTLTRSCKVPDNKIHSPDTLTHKQTMPEINTTKFYNCMLCSSDLCHVLWESVIWWCVLWGVCRDGMMVCLICFRSL